MWRAFKPLDQRWSQRRQKKIDTHGTLILPISFVHVCQCDGVLRVVPECIQEVTATAGCHTWYTNTNKLAEPHGLTRGTTKTVVNAAG